MTATVQHVAELPVRPRGFVATLRGDILKPPHKQNAPLHCLSRIANADIWMNRSASVIAFDNSSPAPAQPAKPRRASTQHRADALAVIWVRR
jgi:hypothetical protein